VSDALTRAGAKVQLRDLDPRLRSKLAEAIRPILHGAAMRTSPPDVVGSFENSMRLLATSFLPAHLGQARRQDTGGHGRHFKPRPTSRSRMRLSVSWGANSAGVGGRFRWSAAGRETIAGRFVPGADHRCVGHESALAMISSYAFSDMNWVSGSLREAGFRSQSSSTDWVEHRPLPPARLCQMAASTTTRPATPLERPSSSPLPDSALRQRPRPRRSVLPRIEPLVIFT